jgi:hypothetical protein
VEAFVAVWVAVLVALAALFVAVSRRVGQLVARTRELERFQRAIAEIDAATGSVVDPLLGSLDGFVRNHSGDPAELAGVLPHAAASLRDTLDRAKRIEVPSGLATEAERIIRELDRAARSADLAAGGLESMVEGRRDRQGESSVEVKRSVLNLRHARDTVRTEASTIAGMTANELLTRRDSPWARKGSAPSLYVAGGTEDDDHDR